jgi:hypothetical protein
LPNSEPPTAKSATDQNSLPPLRPFWRWFIGARRDAGWRKLLDRWLLLHLAVGVVAAALYRGPLADLARSVLLPLVGVLIGMAFAWVGTAQAILQSAEVDRLVDEHPGGAENYVYTFQLSILVILTTLVAWGLAATGLFDQPCPWSCPAWGYSVAVGTLFALASLTVRECWQVVVGAQMLLLIQRVLRRHRGGQRPGA